jgi:hypothetical protein
MARSMDQRGDAVKEGRLPDVLGVETLDLRTVGDPENDVELNLPALLRHLLARRNNHGKTWAQLLIEGWIVDALEGNFRALEEVLDRAGTGRPSGASAADDFSPLDDAMISKIVEALCETGEDATSH